MTVQALTLAVAVLMLLTACGRNAGPEQRMQRAEQFLARGDYGEAIVELRNALQKQPDNARVQLLLVQANLKRSDLEAAEVALRAAETGGAQTIETAEYRAELMLLRGEYEPLLRSIERQELRMPEPQQTLMRARALKGLQRWAEATTAYEPLTRSADAAVRAAAIAGMAECWSARGNVFLALKQLQDATHVEQSAQLWLALGSLQRQLGETSTVDTSWNNALRLAPGQLTVLQHAGLLDAMIERALARAEQPRAQTLFDQLTMVAPQSVLTTVASSRLAIAGGNAASAVADLQRLQTAEPDVPGVGALLTVALLAQGSTEQAGVQLGRLAQSDGGKARVEALLQSVRGLGSADRNAAAYWLHIGALQLAMGAPDAARVAFAKAVAVEPGSIDALTAQVSLELRVGNAARALDMAQRLTQKLPSNAVVQELLAQCHMALGSYQNAVGALEKSWQLQPTVSVATTLATARIKAGSNQPLRSLTDWLQSKPADVAMRKLYAEGLRQTGQVEPAIAEYQRILAQEPRDVAALNNLAWLYHLRDDRRALPLASQALALAGGSPQVADTYGWLQVQAGSAAAGMPHIERALKLSPGDPDVVYHYAATLAALGRRDEARQFLDGLLAARPEFESRPAALKLLQELR